MKVETLAGLAIRRQQPFAAAPLEPTIDAGVDRVDEAKARRHMPDHVTARRIVQICSVPIHAPEAVFVERKMVPFDALQHRPRKRLHHSQAIGAFSRHDRPLHLRSRRAAIRRTDARIVFGYRQPVIRQYAWQAEACRQQNSESQSNHWLRPFLVEAESVVARAYHEGARPYRTPSIRLPAASYN